MGRTQNTSLAWKRIEKTGHTKIELGEVVELADTADLKSAERIAHAGSSPAFATKKNGIFPETKIEINVDDI